MIKSYVFKYGILLIITGQIPIHVLYRQNKRNSVQYTSSRPYKIQYIGMYIIVQIARAPAKVSVNKK